MRCLVAALPVLAATTSVVAQVPSPGEDGKYTISSSGITAKFIPYGATLTNLFVKDKNGEDVDVVLGYDDIDYYPKDPGHPVYNSIPGRYVNRIGKGKYTIDNTTYETQINDGTNTLHSGTNNWSYRVWNVSAVTDDSITFTVRDASNSSQGMLGLVKGQVTYSVSKSTWKIAMEATSPEAKTPLMLTHHTYFNLDAYRNPDTLKIWNHTLYLPYSKRYLVADDGALPTGKIATAEPNSINDFASRAGLLLGHARGDPKFSGNCGGGGACEGYNGYFLIDDAPKDAAVVQLASEFSGITADLRTDQSGVVVYSCNWMDGTADLKSTQGTKDNRKVVRSSCIAIEAQDYVDGINHPEWGRVEKQITGPGQTYSWESSWTFGNL
ncbi:galactose mutarotase-like protein [Annulohypoxylon nitens]|nr:galactose mutarotase-like protein [Annulohypoxylon nitens]KAI1445827.1 galactose mutarotase-like protein [Annulohypoxylon stygium]